MEMFASFLRLHGKTHDYKIKYSSIVKTFLLPKPDDIHYYFVVCFLPSSFYPSLSQMSCR